MPGSTPIARQNPEKAAAQRRHHPHCTMSKRWNAGTSRAPRARYSGFMATRTLVTEDEYLHTAYEPDCEFEDGVLIGRNVGARDHSGLQAALASWFFRRRKAWAIHVYTEQRIKMRDGKYMIPDICVVQGPEPAEQVFTAPPLIWIEILSPEDRHVRINQDVQQP